MTALVLPPIAAKVRIAFSNASRVKMCESFTSSCTNCTMRLPASRASTLRRPSTAGYAAFPGKPTPNASTMLAMVLAVPIVMQWPWLRCMQLSASKKSCSFNVPARTCSLMLHTPVPEPNSWPRHLPLSIGPPLTPMVGKLALEAPINKAGVVLSQPINSTTPSIGLPRMLSSTSMEAKLRYNMAVGRNKVSPNDITGNSRGKPPASYTPILTCSAKVRKWELQGVSSLKVLQIPMTGRPSNWSCGTPLPLTQLR